MAAADNRMVPQKHLNMCSLYSLLSLCIYAPIVFGAGILACPWLDCAGGHGSYLQYLTADRRPIIHCLLLSCRVWPGSSVTAQICYTSADRWCSAHVCSPPHLAQRIRAQLGLTRLPAPQPGQQCTLISHRCAACDMHSADKTNKNDQSGENDWKRKDIRCGRHHIRCWGLPLGPLGFGGGGRCCSPTGRGM